MDSAPGTEDQFDITNSATHPRRYLRYTSQEWNSHRLTIERLYLDEDKQLSETMALLDNEYNFRPSIRTFKDKIKEWGLRKYIPAPDMAVVVAKAEKRKHEEGKETVIYVDGRPFGVQRLETFKKRKSMKEIVASPSAATPPYIAYDTPKLEMPTLQTLFSEYPTTTPLRIESGDAGMALLNDSDPGCVSAQTSVGHTFLRHNGRMVTDSDSACQVEPQTSVPLHKWGVEDCFMNIFEAGTDFPGFLPNRVPQLMSASSPKAAFGIIDDQIREIRHIVFCLERTQPWISSEPNDRKLCPDPGSLMRTLALIDKIVEHVMLCFELPLFAGDKTDNPGIFWRNLGISPDERLRPIAKRFRSHLLQWQSLRSLQKRLQNAVEIPFNNTINRPIIAEMAASFVFMFHPQLLMIGLMCAKTLKSSDGMSKGEQASFDRGLISYMRTAMDCLKIEIFQMQQLHQYFCPNCPLYGRKVRNIRRNIP